MFESYLFAALEGTLIQDGEPVAGATIIREAMLGDESKTFTDQAITDEQGHFRFPEMKTRSLRAKFMLEKVVFQQLLLIRGDERVEIYDYVRRSFTQGENIRVKGLRYLPEPLQLSCNLDEPSFYQDTENRVVAGVCSVKGLKRFKEAE